VLYKFITYIYLHTVWLAGQDNGAILAWARDPKGYERQLGELVAQFQYNYDIHWQSWVYSDWHQDGACTSLRDYKVRHVPCDTLLPFACERGLYHLLTYASALLIIVVLCFSLLTLFRGTYEKKQKCQ